MVEQVFSLLNTILESYTQKQQHLQNTHPTSAIEAYILSFKSTLRYVFFKKKKSHTCRRASHMGKCVQSLWHLETKEAKENLKNVYVWWHPCITNMNLFVRFWNFYDTFVIIQFLCEYKGLLVFFQFWVYVLQNHMPIQIWSRILKFVVNTLVDYQWYQFTKGLTAYMQWLLVIFCFWVYVM